jgi:anaerobic ribonucleoside-triphosphate reductase
MIEETIVRENLMTREGYSGYCGDDKCLPRTSYSVERWPRTEFNGEQFRCPKCEWLSNFPESFITRYKEKWNL